MKNQVAVLMMVVLSVGLMLSACAPKSDEQLAAAQVPGSYDHLSSEEKVAMSQVLVDEAEEKARLATLPEAYGLVSEAIRLDKDNYRAQFWIRVFQSMLEFKGIVARARPLYLQQKDGANRYMALLDAINRKNVDDSEYVQYIMSGPNDIESDEAFRSWMDRALVSMNELRSWIKANRDRELELNAPSELFRTLLSKRCERSILRSRQTEDGSPRCQPGRMASFKLNRADYEILLSFLNLYTLQMSIFYAYRTHSLILFESDRIRNPQEYMAFLLDGQKNDLRSQHRLGLGIEIAQDWAVASRQIVAAQAEYCPQAPSLTSLRPQGYLFSTGFCYILHNKTVAEKNLSILDAIVAGRPLSVTSDGGDEISVNVTRFFSSPPEGIAKFRPTKFDMCGNPKEFDESAFEKIVTKGSVNQFVRTMMFDCKSKIVPSQAVSQ